MRSRIGVAAAGLLLFACTRAEPEARPAAARSELPLRLSYSLMIGGDGDEEFRDVAVAPDGTAFAAGRTASSSVREQGVEVVRAVAPDPAPNAPADVLVVRIAPDGRIVWMRVIGGPGVDLAYAIEIAPDGDLIVAGRAGQGFPTTAGSARPEFGGDEDPNARYGAQDGFVAKLSAETGETRWSTFIGGADSGFIRDVDVDGEGNSIVVLADVDRPVAFVPGTPPGGGDGIVAKLAADGSRILWARYVGGSTGRDDTLGVRVERSTGRIFAVGNTSSRDLPAPGGFDTTFAGPSSESANGDLFVVELSPDGDLDRGTFFGGSGAEGTGTHNIAIGDDGRLVVGHWTTSTDLELPPGGYQATNRGGDSDAAFWRVAPTGELQAGSYLGSSGGENIQGIALDSEGRVYASVDSLVADDFPVTADAYQGKPTGEEDGALAVLSPDLDRLLYATRIGGGALDRTRALALDAQGGVVLAGVSKSQDWPVTRGEKGMLGSADAIVVRFERQ